MSRFGARARETVCVLVALGALSGCRTGRNYLESDQPMFRGVATPAPCGVRGTDRLLVVTFNVQYSIDPEGAAELLDSEPDLRCADVVLLQEMDGPGTELIAERLGMSWVYYPAVFHFRYDRDFGNAVLSRWPISDSRKLILPHASTPTGTQRIATRATVEIDGTRVLVYSTHLGAVLEIGPGARRAQLTEILDDAADHEFVVIGGDMNSSSMGQVAEEYGFHWPTASLPPTVLAMTWDHVFAKGFAVQPPPRAGTPGVVDSVSDHAPVWTLLHWMGR